ncbi:MAG TPA: MoxR family ATPase [Polyangiaceae bacterium]|jgi:MoxR-like ATPase|nr:MoxR family ATPase [Polyangiaceae bacterium]
MSHAQAELVDKIAAAKERIDAVRREVASVYIGSTRTVDHILVALMARGHVLLEGVPGVAKTTLAKAFARSLGVQVRRIQFTPDLLPADITGTYVLSPREGTFTFRRGPIFANVVLADEINRAPPKTQAALLEAMQEQQVTIEGEGFALPNPFIVVATQNPIDLEGTYPLPEAQIDRFLVHLSMGYPTREDEVKMLMAHHIEPAEASPMIDADVVAHLQRLVRSVHVEQDLYEYAVALSEFTRADKRVLLGASPRATLGLIQVAKAAAIMGGRGYATPDDLREFAVPVLAHRLVLSDEVDGESGAREDIVRMALAQVSYRKAIRPV